MPVRVSSEYATEHAHDDRDQRWAARCVVHLALPSAHTDIAIAIGIGISNKNDTKSVRR